MIFCDTTSTSWETEAEDIDDDGDSEQAAAGGDRPLRRQGHSKDHRPDLPQVVLAGWQQHWQHGHTTWLQRTSQAGSTAGPGRHGRLNE